MTQVSKPTREAITFAFVAHAFERRSDAMHGLVPLFAAAIRARVGQIFAADQIAKDVNLTFDFDISPLVVEGMIPALVSEGLLKEIPVPGTDSAVYKCLAESVPAELSEIDKKVQSLFERYRKYARAELDSRQLQCTDEDLDLSLLDALTANDFLQISLRRDSSRYRGRTLTLRPEVEEFDVNKALSQALVYLSGSFMQSCLAAGESEVLIQASWGALVSEVVIALQRPSADTGLEGLEIYFDGPILLDALDCGDESSVRYAKDLIDLASRSGATLCTFSHMVEEMQEILRVLLAKYDQSYPISGALAERIKKDQYYLVKVRATLQTLPARLEALGVTSFAEREFGGSELVKYFPDEKVTSLRAWISQNHFHEHVQRDLRDAKSIAYTLRLRKGVFASSISTSGAIFVTRNPGLVKATQRFLTNERMLPEYTPPPCVSDRQLAGVLWFCTGGGGQELTRSKLVANCSVAVTPRTDLVSTMAQHLLDHSPEEAREFEALIRDDRAAMCLVKETLSVASFANADNVQGLLEKMREAFKQSAGEEYEQRLASEMAAIEERHSTALSLKDGEIAALDQRVDSLEQELRDAHGAALLDRGQMQQIAEQNAGLLAGLRREEETRQGALNSIRARHDAVEIATRKRLRLELLVLLGLSLSFAARFTSEPVWGPTITTAATIAGLWWLPDKLLGPVIRWISAKDRRRAEKEDAALTTALGEKARNDEH